MIFPGTKKFPRVCSLDNYSTGKSIEEDQDQSVGYWIKVGNGI
jgi:hypothetical protein